MQPADPSSAQIPNASSVPSNAQSTFLPPPIVYHGYQVVAPPPVPAVPYYGGMLPTSSSMMSHATIGDPPRLVFYPPPPSVSAAEGDEVADGIGDVQRCHLHTKPQLSCKLCRRFKGAVHEMGRIALAQQANRPIEDHKHMLEMTDSQTFNVNNLLRGNILSSEYYKSLYSLKNFNEVVDEIYHYAEHAEPYVAGNSRAPSTLFCCLYKLFTMKLTKNQVATLLDHTDSPYIRCSGFLYLRYVHPPEKLWEWFEVYFLDDERFTPGSDKVREVTLGEYVESLITEDKYFNTVLPRLPVKIKNQYGAQLIAMDEHRKRKQENKLRQDKFVAGCRISACSNGDWLDGEVISLDDSLPGRLSVVVQLEDGSEETIDIGLVVLTKKAHKRDEGSSSEKKEKSYHHSSKRPSSSIGGGKHHHSHHHRHSGSRRERSRSSGRRVSRSRSSQRGTESSSKAVPKTQEELLREFRRREREKALATGKDYARRPTSYKSSLSLRLETCTARKRSRSPTPVRVVSTRERHRGGSPAHMPHSSNGGSSRSHEPRKKEGPSLEHRQKMAQLMERYSKNQSGSRLHHVDEEGPDVMRLG